MAWALTNSLVLHISILALVLFLPSLLAARNGRAQRSTSAVLYDLTRLETTLYLPTLRSAGPGGKPGRGTEPDHPPALGSTAFHPRAVVVSNPPRPDNLRQTIIQPEAPPELRIPFDVDVPNILAGNPSPLPRPPQPAPRALRPLAAPKRVVQAEEAAAPSIPAQLRLAAVPPLLAEPSLPVPVAPAAESSVETSGNAAAGSVQEETHGEAVAGAGTGLIALGLEPGAMRDLLNLPRGNRYGAFSISPAGGTPGSPGGVPGGSPSGGTGGAGSGGDGSVGVGPGASGGGGREGTPGVLTASGGEGKSGVWSASSSDPRLDGKIFPVLSSLVPQRPNALRVIAGPRGGGGLRVYGVLRSSTIHTTYVPMPGGDWTLQYGLLPSAEETPYHNSGSIAVERADALQAPWAAERYDFERPDSPRGGRRDMIVMYGVVDAQGELSSLKVIRSPNPALDELALAAVSRWRFHPAEEAGKPVAVEILLGVPVTAVR